LNPKKIKPFLKSVSEDLDMDQSLVIDVYEFYWSNVRKSLTTVPYPRINIENLGVFEVKLKTLDLTIQKYKAYLNKLDAANFSKYPKYENAKKRLDVLEATKEILLEERERKKQIKISRHGNTTGDMEAQGTDS
jgi:hypothetical protein